MWSYTTFIESGSCEFEDGVHTFIPSFRSATNFFKKRGAHSWHESAVWWSDDNIIKLIFFVINFGCLGMSIEVLQVMSCHGNAMVMAAMEGKMY